MKYRWNYYVCKYCRQSTIARNEPSVVTPMFSTCEWCGGDATSEMAWKDEVADDILEKYPVVEFYYRGHNGEKELAKRVIRYSPFVQRRIKEWAEEMSSGIIQVLDGIKQAGEELKVSFGELFKS